MTKSSKKGSKREEERKVKGAYVKDKIMKKFSKKCNEDIVGPFKNI